MKCQFLLTTVLLQVLPFAAAFAAGPEALPTASELTPKLVQKLRAPFEGKEELQCDSVEVSRKEVLTFVRAQRENAKAWKVTFKRPFECRWQEPRKQPWGAEGAGEEGKRLWIAQTRGVVWITVRNGAPRFDLEELRIGQKAASTTPSPSPSPGASPSR